MHFQAEISPADQALFLPLLYEIAHGLEQLLKHQQVTLIDFYHLPWSDQAKQRFLELLGSGEVTAELAVLGRSMVRETALTGVWCIEHYHEERLMSQVLEITACPEILRAQAEDIQTGLTQLQQSLATEYPHHAS